MKKGLAFCAAALSIAVVWSEVTFFNKQPVLSIFANIVNLAKVKYDYVTIEVRLTTSNNQSSLYKIQFDAIFMHFL